ncbi:hypothetical protein BTA51_08090 [Hahella sp. CCB-MM4]|uniref:RHS repeat protein n=1 Tax=Hahella sp. (strain CCB-MM4) TaxID=1926491 RepID=UPI000B9C5E44|nr:RHS repeat protein [Hahella sp. CCB-MM4]OZG73762.1 hypothetical protein BTA51_08090 [Hahella sp. CCB-MM4]
MFANLDNHLLKNMPIPKKSALAAAMSVFSLSALADLPTVAIDVTPKVSPPFYTSTGLGITKGDTAQEALVIWWELYMRHYKVKPYGKLDCVYLLRSKTDGDIVANAKLALDCNGGVNIYGTPGCPTGYAEVGSMCKIHGVIPDKNRAGGCPTVADSVSLGVGETFLREVDYLDADNSLLFFSRMYSSKAYSDINTISGWRNAYSRRVNYRNVNRVKIAEVVTDDGQAYSFTLDGDKWVSDPDVNVSLRLFKGDSGLNMWEVQRDGLVEIYNNTGRLLSVSNASGEEITLSYYANTDLVQEIVATNGKKLQLFYQGAFLSSMIAPNGQQFVYEFDAKNNLATLSRKDNPEASPVLLKRYHYENAKYSHHMTSLTDGSGVSIATWTYDEQGRTKSAVTGDDAESYTIVYNEDESVTVTRDQGQLTTYYFETIYGVRKVVRVDGDASSSCASSEALYTYDVNGYLDTVTDRNGLVTDYDYNRSGKLVRRVEAKNSPAEHTVTFE